MNIKEIHPKKLLHYLIFVLTSLFQKSFYVINQYIDWLHIN